jgi:ribosomal protein S18 acetylase RimI-like enzyme
MKIIKADKADLKAILELQYSAYQSEARLVNDFSLPPLTQTLKNITEDFNSGIILKAVEEDNLNEIIGSVRGRFSDGTLYIGRLMVNPSHQNQGIGTALLSAVESFYPHMRYELFTSDKSNKNLSLYIKPSWVINLFWRKKWQI